MKKYRKMLVVFVVGIFLLSGMLTGAVAIKINHAQKLPNQPNIKKTLHLRGFLLRVIELLFERIKNLKGLGYENNDDDNDDNIISMNTCLVDLPLTSVFADMIEIWGAAPLYSYLSVELSGIIGSYDVENKIYPGWCIDYHTPLPFGPPMPIPVMLHSSYCPPGVLVDDGWEEVNHILNNKLPGATWNDIHVAITQFVNFGDLVAAPAPLSIAGQMVSAAQAHPDFIPQPGDVVAVIVDPMEEEIGIFPIENEWGCHDRWQYTIIEVPIPTFRCTRTYGYWKTHSSYGPAPYDPTWADIGEDTEFFTTGQTYYEILCNKPKGGNAYLILAHQYIAAELNGLANNGLPTDIEADMLQAYSILDTYAGDLDIPKDDPNRELAINLAGNLDAFNNGLSPGWPHCED
jgi:hypothetical protein